MKLLPLFSKFSYDPFFMLIELTRGRKNSYEFSLVVNFPISGSRSLTTAVRSKIALSSVY